MYFGWDRNPFSRKKLKTKKAGDSVFSWILTQSAVEGRSEDFRLSGLSNFETQRPNFTRSTYRTKMVRPINNFTEKNHFSLAVFWILPKNRIQIKWHWYTDKNIKKMLNPTIATSSRIAAIEKLLWFSFLLSIVSSLFNCPKTGSLPGFPKWLENLGWDWVTAKHTNPSN